MNPAAGYIQGRRLQAASRLEQSRVDMFNVVDTLRNSSDVIDASLLLEDKIVPLQDYILGVHNVGEFESFFSMAPYFNLNEAMPLGLTTYLNQFNSNIVPSGEPPLSREGAQNVLEKWNAFTWSKRPGVWDSYEKLSRRTRYVADSSFNGWQYNGSGSNPLVASLLESFLETEGIDNLTSTSRLRGTLDKMRRLERNIKRIPTSNPLDLLSSRGRQKISRIDSLTEKTVAKIKEVAKELIPTLRDFGNEFRTRYVIEHHPELVQGELPL